MDISEFFRTAEPSNFSASKVEKGEDAGRITWHAALDHEPHMVTDEDDLADLRRHLRGFGAWSAEEIDGWTVKELNALFVQLVSAEMREGDIGGDMTEEQWLEYEAKAQQGTVSGRIYRADDGTVHYMLED